MYEIGIISGSATAPEFAERESGWLESLLSGAAFKKKFNFTVIKMFSSGVRKRNIPGHYSIKIKQSSL